jgi:hypothetical protein
MRPRAGLDIEPGDEDYPLSVYLKKPQVEALGLPLVEGSAILVVIYSKPGESRLVSTRQAGQ